ncbi:MAG TPA: creatininase family protein [Candidatus Dormibacteraeota bacterium]|jgi:creatinine amidohydrolase|nr:creatininase family protein [Candidatus Dormibacteraeota bacterium]
MSERRLPSVWINELTWQEVDAYLRQGGRVVVLPAGTTEQHGPAGPCGLDTYVAIALAEDVARRSGVLVAPPLWYGDSSHHGAFPGTLTLRTETLMLVVRDICRSLARHGFDRILIINGHKGANLPALTSAVRNLHEEELPQVLFAVADPLHLARSVAGRIKDAPEHHSGELELSQVYHRFPHLVRTDRLTQETVDFAGVFGGFVGADLFGPAPDGVEIVWSSREQRTFAPDGSFSPSAGLSADKGQRYHEHMVDRLCRLVEWMRSDQGPIGRTHRPAEVSG